MDLRLLNLSVALFFSLDLISAVRIIFKKNLKIVLLIPFRSWNILVILWYFYRIFHAEFIGGIALSVDLLFKC